MRNLLAVLLPVLTASLSSIALAAAEPDFDVQALDASVSDPAPEAVVAGSLDSRFGAFNYRDARRRGGPFWLKLRSTDDWMPAGIPTVTVHKGRHLQVQLFAIRAGEMLRLQKATELPGFSGMQDSVFLLPRPVRLSSRCTRASSRWVEAPRNCASRGRRSTGCSLAEPSTRG